MNFYFSLLSFHILMDDIFFIFLIWSLEFNLSVWNLIYLFFFLMRVSYGINPTELVPRGACITYTDMAMVN